jgi:hypothetical protein
MKDPFAPKDPKQLPIFLAVTAFALLVLSNLAWLFAYSVLARQVVGVQANPAPTPVFSVSPTPSPTPVTTRGVITGSVGYPAGTAPAQTVCAVLVSDSSKPVCLDHPAGNALAYTLSVTAGTYYVYANLKAAQGDFNTTYRAYYDKFVTCGESSSCDATLHGQYISVVVSAGGTVSDVNPTDWYK